MRTAACIAALLVLATVSCRKEPPAAPSANYGKMEVLVPATPAEQTYTVRAVVMGLPASGRAYLELHHEEIPTFVGRDGSAEGMKEMIMDFPSILPTVDLGSIHVGDKVEVTFEVRWKSDPRTVVTGMRPLPGETALNLKPVQDTP
ncbi:MAG: copper-binding protein [Phycisphaerales bacterium]